MMRLRTAVLATIAIFASACAGAKARENVLLPAMNTAYEQVLPLIVKGTESLPSWNERDPVLAEAEAMRLALKSGDVAAVIAVDWDFKLHPSALEGVRLREKAGELGPIVAAEFVNLVEEFDVAYQTLRGVK